MSGALLVLEAGPEYKVVAEAKGVLPAGRFTTTPAVAGGRIYVKNDKGDMICLEANGR